MSLYESLIIVLPVLTGSIAISFMMLNTMMENKKGFINILISFLVSWLHAPCSATTISEKNQNISETFVAFNMIKLPIILLINKLFARINVFKKL